MTTPQVLPIRTPEDILALVLAVLGFKPQDSLVLVTKTRNASFHARVDLPEDLAQLKYVVAHLCEAAVLNGAQHAILVAYTDDASHALLAADLMSDALTDVGIGCGWGLREYDGRWFEVEDTEGAGIEYDLTDHPLLLQSRFDDREVYASRDELAASLRGTREEIGCVAECVEAGADRLAEEFKRRRHSPQVIREWMADEVEWALELITAGRDPGDGELARLLLALTFIEIRDRVWMLIDRASAGDWCRFWKAVVRRTPDDLVPAPASLFAFSSWLAGDGAAAWCGIETALDADPDYSLAQLVAQALQGAIPPTVWVPPGGADVPPLAG
jgi:hypothetical protein